MPNWCHNRAKLTFPNQELRQNFEIAIKGECLFSTFVPLDLEEEKWDLEKAVELWGTKWEPGEIQIEEVPPSIDNNDIERIITFETAWAPPIGFYERLNKNYGIFVLAMFHEAGEQVFGQCVYRDSIEKIDYHNYPNTHLQLDRIRERIGINGELDEYMSCEWEILEERWEKRSEDSL